ncbi:hypothetical protein HBB16_17125 [Pseudonocardia sp. MCCB 268]|nr:hypothetical protein [Pseudonocardia cytotoxica]
MRARGPAWSGCSARTTGASESLFRAESRAGRAGPGDRGRLRTAGRHRPARDDPLVRPRRGPWRETDQLAALAAGWVRARRPHAADLQVDAVVPELAIDPPPVPDGGRSGDRRRRGHLAADRVGDRPDPARSSRRRRGATGGRFRQATGPSCSSASGPSAGP